MIKRIIAVSVLLLATLSAFGQNSNKAFYAELSGAGFVMSANFDARFKSDERLGLGYRIGLGFGVTNQDDYDYSYGYVYDDHTTSSFATIPLGINYLLGKKHSSHTFEVGCGITIMTKKISAFNWSNTRDTEGNIVGHFEFMYRKQPVNGGFMWKIGLTPMIGTSGDILPSGAVAFGYAF